MQQASEDIICYKILERIGGRFFTPYRRFPVDIESKILTSKGEIKKRVKLSSVKRICKSRSYSYFYALGRRFHRNTLCFTLWE